MKLLRRSIILAHRYLGIALGLLIIMWFATGIVMMYAGGLPRVTAQLRLERAGDIDLSRVRLTPADAVAVVERRAGPGWLGSYDQVRLSMLLDRPAYRVNGEVVFADTGESLDELSVEQSRMVASGFLHVPDSRLTHMATLTSVDQWTLQSALPLHRFHVDDDAGTQIDVQPRTGEVAALTTRRSRALAWAGVIPHWLYFTALRENQPLWYRLVVWTSAAACVLAALGLVLAITQFRRTRPLRLAGSIPYSGWMRWHYVTGAIFGIFTFTWAFSGLLSMEPFAWTNATGVTVPRDALTGGPIDFDRFAVLDAARWDAVLDGRAIREMEFARIQDEHYYVVRLAPDTSLPRERQERLHQPYYVTGRREPNRLLVHAASMEVRGGPFSAGSVVTRLRARIPDAPVVESELLTEYDSYYYSRRQQTPLPVLRVKFGDPAETWVYIDPEMSEVLAEVPRYARLERWLYNGLHSMDFAFLYDWRPLWDIGMLTLLAGGLLTTTIGTAMGIKRIRRTAVRTARSWGRSPRTEPASALSPHSESPGVGS